MIRSPGRSPKPRTNPDGWIYSPLWVNPYNRLLQEDLLLGPAAAYAELTSTEARRAFVLIRSTGAVALFVNGDPIIADSPSRDFLVVPLARGLNRLLVTTRPGASDWAFECLVSTPDGPPSRPE